MKLLTKDQQESYGNAKICYIYKEHFEDKYAKDKKYRNVRGEFDYTGEFRGAAHNICNLRYTTPTETTTIFHNGSNYGYHFIIKELTEDLKDNLLVLILKNT